MTNNTGTKETATQEKAATANLASDISKNGLWKNNVALVQLLGLCPLLAVTGTISTIHRSHINGGGGTFESFALRSTMSSNATVINSQPSSL